MAFRLAELHLTLAHSNGQGQGQGHPHLDCEFLKLVTDMANDTIAINYKVEYEISTNIFKFDRGLF